MSRRAFWMAMAVCLVSAGAAGFGEDKEHALLIGGRERTWLVHTPPAYDGRKSLPLVAVLHGGGGNADGIMRSAGFSGLADKEGIIVVYPNGSGRRDDRALTWNAGNGSGWALANKIDDVGFFRALFAWLKKNCAVDPKRIYVCGLSNGGMMTYRLACELSGEIAAAAVVSGALADPSPAPARPVPIVIFHGTADEHILYNGGRPKKTIDFPVRNDRPVSFAVDFWVTRNGCSSPPAREVKGAVIHETYGGGAAAVELYTIVGGGHAWPGGKPGSLGADVPTREISATEIIWGFFKDLTLP